MNEEQPAAADGNDPGATEANGEPEDTDDTDDAEGADDNTDVPAEPDEPDRRFYGADGRCRPHGNPWRCPRCLADVSDVPVFNN